MGFPTIQVRDAANNVVTVNTIPNPGLALSDNSLPVVLASDQGPIQVGPYFYVSNTLAVNTGYDFRAYSRLTFQITGLSGGDSIQFSRSITANSYIDDSVVSSNGSYLSTITANGIYMPLGNSYVKWQKTGTSSSPAVVFVASN